jgi:hypothetical protein
MLKAFIFADALADLMTDCSSTRGRFSVSHENVVDVIYDQGLFEIFTAIWTTLSKSGSLMLWEISSCQLLMYCRHSNRKRQ